MQSLVWAVVPPLLLLGYYYRRSSAVPPFPQLLLFFLVGAISGLVALGLQWGFEFLISSLINWQRLTSSLPGVALRQLIEVAPIEEGCKLGGVILLQSRHQRFLFRSHNIFLWTIAVALGFTAQENWVYLANGTASISDRLIGTPVHALFSAPWGYALAVTSCSTLHFCRSQAIVRAWLNAVICHALVNILSSTPRYPDLSFFSYGLFPFLLWMFWRLEILFRKVERQPPLLLISGLTPIQRYWQRGLVLFALVLGGNAIFGFFLLARIISSLSLFQLFYPHILWFWVSRLLLNLVFAIIAWGIYKYLRSNYHS